jgi:hypothetical protein
MADRTNPPATAQAPGIPLLAAIAFVLASPAAAQIIPTGRPAADILLARALADHQMLLTCSSLDAATHAAILLGWQQDANAAAAVLAANTVPADAIAAFTTAAAPENLLPAPDTPFSEVKQFCDAYPDWPSRWEKQDFTPLALALPKAFQ